MAGLYSDKVMKYFMHPKNMGEIKNADGVGKVGNAICGDLMWLYIKVKKNKKTGKEIVADVKFKTFGCVAAIATSSMITELVKGKTIEEALKVEKNTIVKNLGGLPPVKIHCSVLAADAFSEAVYDYYRKKRIKIPPELQKTHEKLAKELEMIKKGGHRHLVEQEERMVE